MSLSPKILILGNIGSGKTSLAQALSKATKIPHVGIDIFRASYSDGSPSGEALAWSHFLGKAAGAEPLILECVGGGPFFGLLKMALDESKSQLICFWVDTLPDFCLKRVAERGLDIPYPDYGRPVEPVISAIAERLPSDLSKLPVVPHRLDGVNTVSAMAETALGLMRKHSEETSERGTRFGAGWSLGWKNTAVSSCGTHHIKHNEVLYDKRFDHVLPFHEPGLAPVDDLTGSYHIHPNGEAAYPKRFKRTVGFYQARAAVEDRDGNWFHIHPHGDAAYSKRYAWCGNYQNGCATVRDFGGNYFHIDQNGERLYPENWSYAGDFREGSAVVQSLDGRHSHISETGRLLHDTWWQDLDVYHKGFARARDNSGWTHIQRQGEPIYERRFALVEPFYNRQARVHCFDGSLEIIDEGGDTLHVLRPPTRSFFAELSGDMVGFWKTETIATAVGLGIPDALPGSQRNLSEKLKLNAERIGRLLTAMGEMDLVAKHRDEWSLTAKGAYLRSDHPETLADAALEYANKLHASWKSLPEALREDSPWKPPSIFQDVVEDEVRLSKHHRMLRSYARHDYSNLAGELEIPQGAVVVDAGGGLGSLAEFLSRRNPEADYKVLDLPQVADRGRELAEEGSRLDFLGGDLFQPWPIRADVILLARVLHDWGDEDARKILEYATKALNPGGRIYILEMARDHSNFRGGLCDLHLLTCTGGRERTIGEFGDLLHKVGLRVKDTKKTNSLTTVFTVVQESKYAWRIPESTIAGISSIPRDRPVAMLLRHSVRPFLPPGSAGGSLALTDAGAQLSKELGALIGPRLTAVSASPLARTMQTGQSLIEGAGLALPLKQDRYLGDPGVYSYGTASGNIWSRREHEQIMDHLVSERCALAGLPNPHPAARYLVHHMLCSAGNSPGVHAYVTHDSLISATVGQLAGVRLSKTDWPLYLEAAFFWRDERGVHVRYRDIEQVFEAGRLCPLDAENVLELARREIALTIGLNCKARFYLAGGVFKRLLSGKPPKDLDIWAATEADRNKLMEHLLAKGAILGPEKTYTDEFAIAGRTIEIKKHVKPEHLTLEGVVGGFDLVLSAIAVEHLGRDRWRTHIHPNASFSINDGKVLLLDNLRNWRHSLASLVRMQSYADELGLEVQESEREKIWTIFSNCNAEMQEGLLERFRSSAHYSQEVEQQAKDLMSSR